MSTALVSAGQLVGRKLFQHWLQSACDSTPHGFGGLVSLHGAFCAWQRERGDAPCTLAVFRHLLEEEGFLIGEVCGTALVSGLILREDWIAHQKFDRGEK